jgi:hemolysin III
MRPLARGYIHQAAFYLALCACSILIYYSNGTQALFASVIYSLSLVGMYGVSAFYHVNTWSRKSYLILRRIDHSAIYVLIAGTATPICLLSLKGQAGSHLLFTFWLIAFIGMFMAVIWTHGPKWVRSFLYVAMGWIGIFYYPEIKAALDLTNLQLLVTGGILYTLGAMVYGFKWPDPFPKVFGYHEIFHVFVVIASGFHFLVNFNLAT